MREGLSRAWWGVSLAWSEESPAELAMHLAWQVLYIAWRVWYLGWWVLYLAFTSLRFQTPPTGAGMAEGGVGCHASVAVVHMRAVNTDPLCNNHDDRL